MIGSLQRNTGLLLFTLLCLASACGPDARPKWSAYGSDVLGCAAPGLGATVEAAVGELGTLASGGTADFKGMGIALASKFGVPMALCAVEAAFKRFGGANALPGAAPPAALAARWLQENRAAWTEAAAPPSP